MIRADALRLPAPGDPTAPAYKDWLHVNVFDHRSGAIGLVNVSLHGDPRDPRSRAVGTALLHLPGRGWVGNLEAGGFDDAELGPAAIALERVALALHHESGTVSASARFQEEGFALDVKAESRVRAFAIEEPVPLGGGWFSWYAVGRLAVEGEARVDGGRLPLDGASAYHDHNWGRWHWGDDLGWDWGVFLAPEPGPALIFMRVTDRDHRRREAPALVVHADGRRRFFVGPRVHIEEEGVLDVRLRRVPGPMASLHPDRARPRLPAVVRVRAGDGMDAVELEFAGRAAAQIVTADPVVRGYGFIHEIPGAFRCAGRIRGVPLEAEGLGVVEHAA